MSNAARLLPALAGLLACWLATDAAHAAGFVCASRPDLVGHCFDVNGMLQLYNGTPSARLVLPNGRVLGVAPLFLDDNETFAAPASVRRAVGFGHPLHGSFRVCPLSKPQPGRMQDICIDAELTFAH